VTAGADVPAATPPSPRSRQNIHHDGASSDAAPHTVTPAAATSTRRRSFHLPDAHRAGNIDTAQPTPMARARLPTPAGRTGRSSVTKPIRYSGARRSKKMAP
jgi:hypothetical protein